MATQPKYRKTHNQPKLNKSFHVTTLHWLGYLVLMTILYLLVVVQQSFGMCSCHVQIWRGGVAWFVANVVANDLPIPI